MSKNNGRGKRLAQENIEAHNRQINQEAQGHYNNFPEGSFITAEAAAAKITENPSMWQSFQNWYYGQNQDNTAGLGDIEEEAEGEFFDDLNDQDHDRSRRQINRGRIYSVVGYESALNLRVNYNSIGTITSVALYRFNPVDAQFQRNEYFLLDPLNLSPLPGELLNIGNDTLTNIDGTFVFSRPGFIDVLLTASQQNTSIYLQGSNASRTFFIEGGYIDETSSPPITLPPTQPVPSQSPSSSRPTFDPTKEPSTSRPTHIPTKIPSSSRPTFDPTKEPSTSRPTKNPSQSPTYLPSRIPTRIPTSSRPTFDPTKEPSTSRPTKNPSQSPTSLPSRIPTKVPSSSRPTQAPVKAPSQEPSQWPTNYNPSPTSFTPSFTPSQQPSITRFTQSPAAAFLSLAPSMLAALQPSPTPTGIDGADQGASSDSNGLWTGLAIGLAAATVAAVFAVRQTLKARNVERQRAILVNNDDNSQLFMNQGFDISNAPPAYEEDPTHNSQENTYELIDDSYGEFTGFGPSDNQKGNDYLEPSSLGKEKSRVSPGRNVNQDTTYELASNAFGFNTQDENSQSSDEDNTINTFGDFNESQEGEIYDQRTLEGSYEYDDNNIKSGIESTYAEPVPFNATKNQQQSQSRRNSNSSTESSFSGFGDNQDDEQDLRDGAQQVEQKIDQLKMQRKGSGVYGFESELDTPPSSTTSSPSGSGRVSPAESITGFEL